MKYKYAYTKLRYNGHESLIRVVLLPNWFEKYILRKTMRIKIFVGHGTKWKERDHNGNIRTVDPKDCKGLEAVERGVILEHKQANERGHHITKAIH